MVMTAHDCETMITIARKSINKGIENYLLGEEGYTLEHLENQIDIQLSQFRKEIFDRIRKHS